MRCIVLLLWTIFTTLVCGHLDGVGRDAVYAITLDGNLYSIGKDIGHINWNVKLSPLTTVFMDSNFESELFPNPKDGTIYVNLVNSTNLKLMPYTIPELVHISPIMSKEGLMFIGDKRDEWLILDDTQGRLIQRLSSNDIWKTCPSIFTPVSPGGSDPHIPRGHGAGDDAFRTLYIAKSEYNLGAFNVSSQTYAWNVTYVTYRAVNRYSKPSVARSPTVGSPGEGHVAASKDSSLIPLAVVKTTWPNETYYSDCHRGALLTLNTTTSSVKWSIELSAPVVAVYGLQCSHANHDDVTGNDDGFAPQNLGPVNLVTVNVKDFLAHSLSVPGLGDSCRVPTPSDSWDWGSDLMAAVYLGQYNVTNASRSPDARRAQDPPSEGSFVELSEGSFIPTPIVEDKPSEREQAKSQTRCRDCKLGVSTSACRYALPSLLSGTLSRRRIKSSSSPLIEAFAYPQITGSIDNESKQSPDPAASGLNPSSADQHSHVTTFDRIISMLDKIGLAPSGLNDTPALRLKNITNPHSTENEVLGEDPMVEESTHADVSSPSSLVNATDPDTFDLEREKRSGKIYRDRYLKTRYSLVGKFIPYPVEVIPTLELFDRGTPVSPPFHPLAPFAGAALVPSTAQDRAEPVPVLYHPILYGNKWYDMIQSVTLPADQGTPSQASPLGSDPGTAHLSLKLIFKGFTLLLSVTLPFVLVFKNARLSPLLGSYFMKWILRLSLSQRDAYTYQSRVRVGKISLDPRNVLGVGSLGTIVYRGRFGQRDVAVKRVLREHGNMAEREIRALVHSDRHAHVIRYHCAERCGPFVYIALELCQASFGACADAPHVWRHVTALTSAAELCAQMLTGLAHLHSLRIVHRDLKPQNVLISLPAETGQVRAVLSDFGISKNLSTNTATTDIGWVETSCFGSPDCATTVGPAPGTLGWKPKEVLTRPRPASDQLIVNPPAERDAIDHLRAFGAGAPGLDDSPGERLDYDQFKSDVFSSGCVVYYVISGGQHPFGPDVFQRQPNIVNNSYDLSRLCHDNSDDICLRHLLTQMISADPLMRPSASACSQHPFFWSSDKKLQYFMDLSDIMEKADPGLPSVRCLEKGSRFVVKADWKEYIDEELRTELRKFRSYQGSSLRDLLRAMRNKKHHYQELSDSLKEALGPLPDRFLQYFTSRFPYLLIHLYMVGLTTLAQDQPTLNKYFPQPN